MDLGLFNKKSQARGEHGTLIGNWVEERALQQTTGFARYEDLSIEKTALNQTQDRILSHNNGSGSGSGSGSGGPAQRISTSAATYTGHGAEHFTPKIFNQTGNHWHHDQGIVTGTAQRRDLQSHIQLGTDTGSYSSTQGSSFLHPTTLLPSVQVPLALQQTTRFVPRPFPDTHVSGGSPMSKLDRPYAVDQ